MDTSSQRMPIEKELSVGITNQKIQVNGLSLESGIWPRHRVCRNQKPRYL